MAGHDGRRCYIHHTAVIPEYRKKGVAKRLAENATDALYREGINKAALVVFEKNEIGNSFWESAGFKVRNDLVYRNKNIHEHNKIDN